VSLVCATFLLARPGLAADASPKPNPVDVGSRTSGIGTDRAPQPGGDPRVDVRPQDVPPGSGPDTPGKTGLGNTDRGPVGGAATGPGTRPETGAPVGPALSPAAPGAVH
jgi:hypothetical protein